MIADKNRLWADCFLPNKQASKAGKKNKNFSPSKHLNVVSGEPAKEDQTQADGDIQLFNIYLKRSNVFFVHLGNGGNAAGKKKLRSAQLGLHFQVFFFFFFLFSFYWGEIFNIAFHSSPRNEYFSLPGVYG